MGLFGKKSDRTAGSGSRISPENQKKLDLVEYYDKKAGDALVHGDHKNWEENSKRAQEIDDSIK